MPGGGAGSRGRQGWGWRAASAVPKTRRAGERAAPRGRRASERASELSRPGHGAAGGGRAGAGVAAARAAARGECAGGGAGAPGVGSPRPPARRGPEAAELGLWPGTAAHAGHPRPARAAPPSGVRLSRGASREPSVGPGAGPAGVGARGAPGHVVQSPSLDRHGPACHSWGPGRKLQAGWEPGRARAPLCQLGKGALTGDGDPVNPHWKFTTLCVPLGA